LNDQPEKLVETLLERFDVNGVVPVTKADIQRTMMEVFRGENSPLHDIMKALQSLKSSETTQTQMSTAHREELTYSAEAHLWSKDNHFHLVPDNFRFPSYNVSTMWELWFFGDTQKKICPFKFISRDLTTSLCRTNFCRCKKVINVMIKFAIDREKIRSIKDVSRSNGQEIYEYAYEKLLQEIYDTPPPRPASININTIAKRVTKHKL
jgi:hypothetical protein